MKRKLTFLITAAFMLLTMMATTGTMWGQAPVNTTLWEETWTGGSAGTTPSDYDFSGTTVYGGATLTYAQSSTATKLYAETLAGGTSPELLLSKSNQTWTISNIPTGQATEMSLTFLSNKTTFAVTSSTTGITISGSQKSWTISATNSVTNFNLTIKNTGSANARIDNILLKVTTAGGGGSLSNSDLTLAGAPVALNFDLYNNSSAQVINYTTSSTGAVTVSTSDYVTTSVNTTNKTITVTPTAVTPSAQTITVSQAADASYNAGSATFTVTITNTPPAFTVTLGDDSSTLTETSSGAGVTLPTRETLNGYNFAGWSETNVATETTTAPTIIPAGEYHPTANITLYPVYSKTVGGGGSQNASASVTIADYASANNWNNGTAYQPLTMNTYISIGGEISGNNFKYYTSDNSWRFYTNGSFTISASNNATLSSVTLTFSGGLSYNSSEITSGTAFDVTGTSASISCTANAKITAISVSYTIPGSGTTYYWSSPVAATVETPDIVIAENPFLFSTTATITCATEGAAIKYSYDSENWSDYSAPLTITETKTIYAKAIKNDNQSSVASVTATKDLAVPTITIDATGITNTNVFTSTTAGSLSASVTYNDEAIEGAVVTWSGNADAVATIDASTGAVTLVAAGSVTFTATYAGNGDFSEKTATYQMTVTNTDPNAPGSADNPYTVAQARAAIDAGTGLTGVYATGIVSQIVTAYNSQYGNISYNMSADGLTTSDQLQAYRGKSYDGANFTSADDIQVGDIVVVYGTLKKYNSTYEFDQNNQLVSLIRKVKTPTFSPVAGNVQANTNVTISCETQGATIHYTTNGETPTTESTEYSSAISVTEDMTIKAIAVKDGMANSDVASATYTVTVTPIAVAPTFSSAAGLIVAGTTVTMSTTTENATIYYTTDGSEPTTSSISGTTVIINEDCTLKAIAVADGYENSSVSSAAYIVVQHAGTEADPYNVADARIAIDANMGKTGVYATGIVSQIVTAYGYNNYQNITFNIVDEADDEEFLQAFRCVGDDAPNVLVNDNVVVYGDLTKYNSTYEFGQGCQVVSLEHPIVPAITASDVNLTYNATSGSIAYEITNPVDGGALTAAITDGNEGTWLTLGAVGESAVALTCSANEGNADRTATVTLTYTYNTNETVTKTVTVTQAHFVVDYATLPFNWAGGSSTDFNALNGVTTNGLGSDYAAGNAPYLIKLDGNGDYIQVKTNEQPGKVTIGVKMAGGSNTSKITVQASADGESFDDGEELTISGAQNDIVNLETTRSFNTDVRYVKMVFTKGSNVGVGPITIAQVDNTPSITLNQYTYNLNADGGDAELPVTTANLAANPQLAVVFYESDGATTTSYGWISATINNAGNIAGHIDENEGEARTAYFKVSGLANDNTTTVYSDLVTITQATPSAPSIVFGTASMSLEAGGESDRQLNFDYSGLGNNPTFTINYYEQNGTTAATYNHDWLTATITDDKLNVTAGANTGDARTVYLKVYGVKNENVHAESNLVTITQAAQVVDYATLPFNWAGGSSTDFNALNGVTTNGLGSDYAAGNAPYLIKLDGNGDYIQVKTNEQPGKVTIGVKMAGGSNTSKITVQASADGESFDDGEELTISGAQNDIVNLETTRSFNTDVRYVKMVFTKGSNVGVGPITIAQVDNTPSITADDVNIAHDATGGSISYTINNPVEGGSMSSTPTSGGDWLTVGGPSNGSVALTCEQNTGAERTATVRLTYTYNTNQTVIKDVTVTQEGAPAPTFIVSFTVGNDGIFVPNNDFPQDVVEKEAGTYHLPSATKEGYDFTGWSDGNTTYEADAEYTVSDDVDFTAQWTESTTTTGTIAFGSASGSTPINSTSVTGDDNLGNEWTITTVFSGETSFTQNASYSQIGASSKPATSITFTMTLPQQKIISAFEAKFGGFSNTAGDITLKVGDVNVGSGSLNATNDVTVQATNTTEVGTVLTVTVTNIAKGVKCYYISYTLSPAPVVPTINATSGDNLAYDATSGNIIYEIENYEEGTMTAASEADWISNIAVEETDEMGEVTFNVTPNTSNESRSATVTLTFTYDTDKTATANVTVTQNGQPGQPSITVDPESAVVVSDGGAPEFTITYASITIANANDFDVQFYESNVTTTTTQPSWISDLTISGNTTDGFTLTVTVDANTSAERAAYLKVYAFDGDDIIYSNLITISQNEYIPPATYTLVTDIDQVVSGKHYIIASSAENGTAYAMGAQNTNNRAGVAVTVSDANITQTGGVYEFVINGPVDMVKGNETIQVYTIYDTNVASTGYLYAASSSKNYLRAKSILDDNGRWTITIIDNKATIKAQGTYTNNWMRNNGDLFSCYSSGQSDVYLYVKDDDTELEYYGDPVSLEASAFDFTHNTYSVGGTMTITGGPVANDPSSLIIQDGAQLIHESPINATVQNGVTAAPSWTSNVGGGWYFIASPVDDAVIAESILVEPFDLYKYDEPAAMWYAYNGDGDPFTTMERGIGYLHASADDQILAFAGTMIGTETEITKPLSYACTYGDLIGYNLMGNPYTRVLEYGDMKIGGVNVTSFLSLNDAGTEYVTCNLQDNARIRPCQGFFIQATGAGQKLVFNPSSKGTKVSDIGLISIKAGNEEFMDKAYIQIGGGNTLRKIAFSDNNMVYVMDGDDDYAAMTIYELANPIPVHFMAAEPGTYTITVNAKNIDLDYMHLVDEFTNEHIDLLSEPTYTFTSAEGDKPGRFTIVFGIDNVEENFESNVFAYQYEDELVVDGNGTLQIFDVLGRFVSSYEVNGNERISLSSFNTGVYVLRMVGENVKTQKIVVR